MAERDQFDRLDEMIDAILDAGRVRAFPPELATLLLTVSDLRDLPDPAFRARLKNQLIPQQEDVMPTTAIVTKVHPYLIVDGADNLIAFLRQTFDAEVVLRVPTPAGTVMHAEVRVGDSTVEMGDSGGKWEPLAAPLHAYVEDVDATYQRAIAAGARSLYAPVDQPYGDRESGVVDSAGTEWFISTRLQDGPRPPGFGMVTTGVRAVGAARMLTFLEEAFSAVTVNRHESPSGDIAHAELRIGETMFVLGEAHGQWGPTKGAFHLYVEDCDAVYERALRAGAVSVQEPVDRPYGERQATVNDPAGNQWYIGTPI
jgi:uncharacterized glyoxalase superfamily protein PhnB